MNSIRVHQPRKGSISRFVRKAGGWVIGIIGVAGMPGDLGTWEDWIGAALGWLDSVMGDPRVTALAERAVAVAEFVNQPWARVTLVVLALAIIFWGARPFWRLRHKLIFRWRRVLAEQVWISRDAAEKLIKSSSWARLREPRTTTTVNSPEYANLSFAVSSLLGRQKTTGMTDTDKSLLKFDLFVGFTLDGFAEDNLHAVRDHEGVRQYDETSLREFLKQAMRQEIDDEIGPVPRIKLKTGGVLSSR